MAKELDYAPAFILHTRPFKENQLLMEMLVAGIGRISIIGYKGSKKNTAKTALMRPFRALIVQVKRLSGLRTLKSLEENQQLSRQFPDLKGKGLFCGFYLNEIICRLCSADDEYDALYPLYVYCIKCLSVISNFSGENAEQIQMIYYQWVLRQFEYRLIQMLGYGISFTEELTMQQQIEPGLSYQLHSDNGFVIDAAKPSSFSGKDLLSVAERLEQNLEQNLEQELKRTLQNGEEHLLAQSLIQLKLDLRIAKAVLRVCLHKHLGEKPLKSRELFRNSRTTS